jgi:hypothetical protein
MLARTNERARLDLAGEVTPEIVAWAETRAREAGVKRMLTATWEVGGTTAQLLESSGWSPIGFGMRMRIDVAGREFSPRFPEGIRVRTFREGDEERVYRTHLETFQDVLEPPRLTFEEWSTLAARASALPPGPLVPRRGRRRARGDRALRPASVRSRPHRRARRPRAVARPWSRPRAARARIRRVRRARLPRGHPWRGRRKSHRRRPALRTRRHARDAPARAIQEAAAVNCQSTTSSS